MSGIKDIVSFIKEIYRFLSNTTIGIFLKPLVYLFLFSYLLLLLLISINTNLDKIIQSFKKLYELRFLSLLDYIFSIPFVKYFVIIFLLIYLIYILFLLYKYYKNIVGNFLILVEKDLSLAKGTDLSDISMVSKVKSWIEYVLSKFNLIPAYMNLKQYKVPLYGKNYTIISYSNYIESKFMNINKFGFILLLPVSGDGFKFRIKYLPSIKDIRIFFNSSITEDSNADKYFYKTEYGFLLKNLNKVLLNDDNFYKGNEQRISDYLVLLNNLFFIVSVVLNDNKGYKFSIINKDKETLLGIMKILALNNFQFNNIEDLKTTKLWHFYWLFVITFIFYHLKYNKNFYYYISCDYVDDKYDHYLVLFNKILLYLDEEIDYLRELIDSSKLSNEQGWLLYRLLYILSDIFNIYINNDSCKKDNVFLLEISEKIKLLFIYIMKNGYKYKLPSKFIWMFLRDLLNDKFIGLGDTFKKEIISSIKNMDNMELLYLCNYQNKLYEKILNLTKT